MKRNYNFYDQEPDKCVASMLQMILDRNKLYVIKNPDNIIRDFEVVTEVSDGVEHHYASISDLNKEFFEKHNYPLRETYVSGSNIERWYDDLSFVREDFFKYDNDIIIFANYPSLTMSDEELKILYDTNSDKLSVKHVFLVDDIIGDDFYLVCPETKDNGGTNIIKTTETKIMNCFTYLPDRSGLGVSFISRKD